MATSKKTPTAPKRVDVVAMPSLRADGTPDQSEGFTTMTDAADDPRLARADEADEADGA